MTFPRLRALHILTFALAGSAALVPAGCGRQEGVTSSTEPKEQGTAAKPMSSEQKKFRMIGAIYPADGVAQEGAPRWWFLKFTGPAESVSRYEADVHKIIDSVKTTADPDKPITWTLPPGWKEEPASAMRFATLKSADGMAEVSISRGRSAP